MKYARPSISPKALWFGALAFELAVFVVLMLVDNSTFVSFVTVPDTRSYTEVALHFAQTQELPASPRTLGYPGVILLAYLIGSDAYWMHVVIALQLIVNLAFVVAVWRLLCRLAPAVTVRLRLIVMIPFFAAGLGLALTVITDFLAGFFFFVSLYGVLFWRSPFRVALAAICVAIATLLRPTFTALPLLLPLIGWLVGRITSRVPRRQLLIYALLSIVATGVSISYQRASYGYTGPSSVVSFNIMKTLHSAGVHDSLSWSEFVEEHRGRISALAQAPYGELSVTTEEAASRQIFLKELQEHPAQLSTHFAKTFVKYLFVPIEHGLNRAYGAAGSRDTYLSHVRPWLFWCFLPLWILALAPPLWASAAARNYYFLVLLFIAYVLGVSVIAPNQGERIRFPVLAFMLPIALNSFCTLADWTRRRISSRRNR